MSRRLAPRTIIESRRADPALRRAQRRVHEPTDGNGEPQPLFWRPSLIVKGSRTHPTAANDVPHPDADARLDHRHQKRHDRLPARSRLADSHLLRVRCRAATAVQDGGGLWLYRLKSRAQSAELDLELASGGRGLAAELADQLREFSVTQPSDATSALTAPPEPSTASQLLDNRRRWLTKSYRLGGVLAVVLALLCFGFGGYQVYGYHHGTPTKATILSCGGGREDTCRGRWTLDGETQTGRIWGNSDHVPDGSTVDIGVYRGWAFAPRFPKRIFIGGAVCAVMAIFLFMPPRRGGRPAGPAHRGRHAGS